jgi:hypothetical protein
MTNKESLEIARSERARLRPSRSERFWGRVDKGSSNSECWEWIGHRLKSGYGNFSDNPKNLRAHRVAWELTHGPIPPGQQVLHRCDNPPCVNPSHLFLGTIADNVRDAISKGRHVHNPYPRIRIKTPSGETTLIEYAERLGITTQAARLRLWKGRLEGCERI